MERTAGIEPAPRRWQRLSLPLKYVRMDMVGSRGLEPRTRIGAGFTDPLSHPTWRYPEFLRAMDQIASLAAVALCVGRGDALFAFGTAREHALNLAKVRPLFLLEGFASLGRYR